MRFQGLALTLALAFLAAPLAAEAQPAGKVYRVGWLTSSVLHTANVEAFRQGMHALGYRDLEFEFRAAAGRMEQLPTLAAELVALKVDVIVTDGGPAVRAAKEATATIPSSSVRPVLTSYARDSSRAWPVLVARYGVDHLHWRRLACTQTPELLRDAVPAQGVGHGVIRVTKERECGCR